MGLAVITGPMFSGKSRELLLQTERHHRAGRVTELYRAMRHDTPRSSNTIISHDGFEQPATLIETGIEDVKRLLVSVERKKPEVVGIDEFDRFSVESGIITAIGYLLNGEKLVYVAGLNLNFRGEPFPVMERIMPMADDVISLKAVCTYKFEGGGICGRDATRTQRIIDGQPAPYGSPLYVSRGGSVTYEARCIKHHIVPGAPQLDLKIFGYGNARE